MKTETITLEPELGRLGVYLETFSTREIFSGADKIIKELNSQTGIEWKWLGVFMDIACVSTTNPKAGELTGCKVTLPCF